MIRVDTTRHDDPEWCRFCCRNHFQNAPVVRIIPQDDRTRANNFVLLKLWQEIMRKRFEGF